ncbi:MAG: MauE/DoxX family redox-associated membrane protein [Bacteroidales bacterium]|jgi:hypothetical protein
MFKKTFCIFLSVIIGLFFILSAYLKLYPIEILELKIVDTNFFNWFISPFIARFVIFIELLIGILFILNIKLNKVTYKATIVLLIFFTLYLFAELLIYGNNGNCNCLGNAMKLTPIESIVKNIVLILLIIFLLNTNNTSDFFEKHRKYLLVLFSIAALTTPYILNPVNFSSSIVNNDEIGYKLELELIYKNTKVEKPKDDLAKGKIIVAFLSLTCPHCKIAAYKLHIIKKKNPKIPIYFILNGDKKDYKDFWAETHAEEIPHSLFLGNDFLKLSGVHIPAIFWLNNGIVENKVKYVFLNQSDIERWLSSDNATK